MKRLFKSKRCYGVVFFLILCLCIQMMPETIMNAEEKIQLKDTDDEYDEDIDEDENEDEAEDEDEDEDAPVKLDTPQIKSIASTYQGVLLKWSEVEDADSYTIKRNDVKIATVEDNSYLDKSVDGGVNYTYKIIANGDEEDYLSSSAATVKIGKLPKKVSDLKIKKNKKNITLTWKKVSGAKKYIILRAAKKNGTYKKIASVSKTTYSKKKTKKAYYYKVVTQVKNLFSPASKSKKG